jgi:hypothetical protein
MEKRNKREKNDNVEKNEGEKSLYLCTWQYVFKERKNFWQEVHLATADGKQMDMYFACFERKTCGKMSSF